jgi:hypothetical protein
MQKMRRRCAAAQAVAASSSCIAATTLSANSGGMLRKPWSEHACSLAFSRTSSTVAPRATKSQSTPTSRHLRTFAISRLHPPTSGRRGRMVRARSESVNGVDLIPIRRRIGVVLRYGSSASPAISPARIARSKRFPLVLHAPLRLTPSPAASNTAAPALGVCGPDNELWGIHTTLPLAVERRRFRS